MYQKECTKLLERIIGFKKMCAEALVLGAKEENEERLPLIRKLLPTENEFG